MALRFFVLAAVLLQPGVLFAPIGIAIGAIGVLFRRLSFVT